MDSLLVFLYVSNALLVVISHHLFVLLQIPGNRRLENSLVAVNSVGSTYHLVTTCVNI